VWRSVSSILEVVLRVLVTGGAGFIGSHVVDGLLEAGHEVAVVDNLSTGQRGNLNPRAQFFEADIRSQELAAVFDSFKPEVVDHHAAHADVRESLDDPMYDADVNVLGSLNVLQQAVRSGARKMIFISSGGACYGEPVELPCPESHPIRPLSPYGASKAAIELYLHLYRETYGLDFTVLRYANIYGPRQDMLSEEGRVVAIFTQLMLSGGQPRINGDGEQQRDFLYVSDVVAANRAALERGSGQAYNLGSGQPTSVNQIFALLKRITDYPGSSVHVEAKAGEVLRTYLDASKAQRELGWRPEVSLEPGLRQTVDYFRSALAASRATQG
jgi:UDP-glucose 4-epimerase